MWMIGRLSWIEQRYGEMSREPIPLLQLVMPEGLWTNVWPQADLSLLGALPDRSAGFLICLVLSDSLCKLKEIQCLLNGGNAFVA